MVRALLPLALSPSDASTIQLMDINCSGPSSLTLEVAITPDVRRAIVARLQNAAISDKWESQVQDVCLGAPADGSWRMSKQGSDTLSFSMELPFHFQFHENSDTDPKTRLDAPGDDPDLEPLMQRVAMLEQKLAEINPSPEPIEKVGSSGTRQKAFSAVRSSAEVASRSKQQLQSKEHPNAMKIQKNIGPSVKEQEHTQKLPLQMTSKDVSHLGTDQEKKEDNKSKQRDSANEGSGMQMSVNKPPEEMSTISPQKEREKKTEITSGARSKSAARRGLYCARRSR